ncbi:MAG TPA: geranylgeranyl reductase family protein [Candidatus Binatia bacterium]|nr:geranylgeranyl reductase family protein [Candidatus Binatia bacterium]
MLNNKQEFDSDVIVVGAGPAGSAAAHYLSTAGYDVILLDRCKFPRDKVCGDFVSPISQNELAKLGITHTIEFRSANQITKASVYLDGSKLVYRVVPKVEGLPRYGRVVPRLVLDKLLLESACRGGAVFLEGLKAVGMRVKRRSVELEAEGPEGKRTLKARLLIGADGSNSAIARIVRGQPPSSTDRIIAIRGYFEGVEGPSSQADLHFNKESFPGYCWLFPTGKNQANVGVGAPLDTIPSGIHLKELLDHLISNNVALSRRLKNAKLLGKIGGFPLTTYNPSLPLVDDRVMLIGDAAGLVNPLNGEGIQYALLSGRWASEVAISALIADDLSKEALVAYQHTVEQELSYGMSLASLIVQLIRNRSLNPLWLRSLELMAARSRVDSSYADIVGGILMGTVPQSEATTLEVVRGTIEQAMLSTGLTNVLEIIQDPRIMAKSALETIQTGFAVASQATQNPSALFDWAIKSMTSAINAAATSFIYPESTQKVKHDRF